ncbi:ribonuclease P protein component [Amantichitinum ursilacus]|uniref:Ribonuclease P protein component n=1 Tax=Amantichitinum ursilacus TaxID=857265 RepID=A0A0N1JRX8_9NEIS|nr:ribonuclease P protein component [Amantichitinum ursilacus]KPC50199.1 Ribonuclease P protein component [Amantichitinum ursilacus]
MSGATGFRFTRMQRILKTDEFSSVFSLRNTVSNLHFQVLVRPNTGVSARLGLVVGKKTDKRAVARNYMKRTIRETFRLHAHTLHGLDLVVRTRQGFNRREGAAARAELLELFARIRRRCPA